MELSERGQQMNTPANRTRPSQPSISWKLFTKEDSGD